MRAMRAETFSGYEALKPVEVAKPTISDGRVLVRITTAGVTPLDFTILSGKFSRARAPLVLGNEGAGVVTDGGGTDFPVGSRVMFTGQYGIAEGGTYGEWVAVRKRDLCLIPDNVDDVSAAGVPVAYLTAHMTLALAGFHAGKTVLAAAIGGSVGKPIDTSAVHHQNRDECSVRFCDRAFWGWSDPRPSGGDHRSCGRNVRRS
jgi:NADPH2:quinone reductase